MNNRINKSPRLRPNQHGFTIVELIIATSVFSVVLLLAVTGIVTMGKRYYKGVTVTRTQEVARAIQDEITTSIQVSGNSLITRSADLSGKKPNENDYYQTRAICIGDTRYTYVLNSQLSKDAVLLPPVTVDAPTKKHALWMDVKLPTAACTPLNLSDDTPYDSGTSVNTGSSPSRSKEMLINNMRLVRFNIKATGSVFEVDIKVMYGDNDVINTNVLDNPDDDTCRSVLSGGGQFCADSELKTFVKTRL